MIATLEQTGADIVLGLFPTEHASMVDMVRCDRSGRVESILVKPAAAPPGYEKAWINAVWRPRFGDFLHHNLERLAQHRADKSRELYIGDVVMAAIDEGMVAYGTVVSEDACLDAGTPDTYALALTRFNSLTAPCGGRLMAAAGGSRIQSSDKCSRRPTHHRRWAAEIRNGLGAEQPGHAPRDHGRAGVLALPGYPKDAARNVRQRARGWQGLRRKRGSVLFGRPRVIGE
jgi:hypothetical protein